MGGDFLGRTFGFIADNSGFARTIEFLENEYQWKCAVCGRLTDRKADGTEKFGYNPVKPK